MNEAQCLYMIKNEKEKKYTKAAINITHVFYQNM